MQKISWTLKLKPYYPLLALLFIGLIPFSSYIFSNKVLLASDQVGSLGWKFFFDSILSGEFPLWNAYTLGGMPTFDALFGDASYPIFILLGLIIPLKFLISYNFILHVIIAGFTSYFLVRRIWQLPIWISVVLAVGYMLNTNYISLIYAGHTGKFFVISWLPLGLFFLIRLLSDKASWKHALGLCLMIFLFLSTSHIQLTYFVMIGFFMYYVYKILPPLKCKQWKTVSVLSLRFWTCILLGIGLAFFLLWPPIKYNEDHSVRGTIEKQTYEHATSWSLHPPELASFVVPEFTGLHNKYWSQNAFKLNSEYPGIVFFLMAIIALFLCHTRWMIFWSIVAGVVVIFSLGANTPLFKIFYHLVPGIKSFRAPSMTLFWFVTSCFMIFTEFFDLCINKKMTISSKKWFSLKKIIYSLVGLIFLFGLFPSLPYSIWNAIFDPTLNISKQLHNFKNFQTGALRTAVLCVGILWSLDRFLFKKQQWNLLAFFLILISVIDLYWVNSHFIQEYNVDGIFKKEPLIEQLKQDTSDFRVLSLNQTFPRKYLQYHLIEDLNGFADNEYQLYREYRKDQNNSNLLTSIKQTPQGVFGNTLLDMLNVKYLIGKTSKGQLALAPNLNYLPRIYASPQWEFLPQEKILEAIQKNDFEPRSKTFISKQFQGQIPTCKFTQNWNASEVQIVKQKRSNNNHSYSIEMPQEGIIILSDFYYPDWKLTIDATPAPLLQVNHLFQGIYLTKGKHQIDITYQSTWIRKSLWISLISALLLGLFLILFRFLSFKQHKTDSPLST